jgi:hypothetical protein
MVMCDVLFEVRTEFLNMTMNRRPDYEAVRTSQTSIYFYETTRCCIPRDFNIHTCRRENLKSHILNKKLCEKRVEEPIGRNFIFP